MLNKEGLYAEISVGVTFASLMSATALFFTGIIIGQYHSFDPTIKVPLIFLIISTYSFIFSATIFSNAGSEVTLDKVKTAGKYLIYAKNIEEFLGLYLFILATPMVIGAVTRDSFLRTMTIIIALIGISLYSQSKFSILQKELSLRKKRLLTAGVLALSLLLYLSQTSFSGQGRRFYIYAAVALLMVMASAAAYFSMRSSQYKQIAIRPFKDEDVAAIAKIILRNNSRLKKLRYPQPALEAVRALAEPDAIRELARQKRIFTAEFNSKPVGFVCVDGAHISTVFTDPQLRQKGVGRALVDHAEMAVQEAGSDHVQVLATKVDHGFYKKLGYSDIEKRRDEYGANATLMQKAL